MATTTVKATATSFITASAGAILTVSSGSVIGNLKELVFCNTSTITAYNFTAYNVPSGGTAQLGNELIPQSTINAATFVRFPFNTFLAAASQIQVVANVANVVTVTPSYVEFS